MKKFLLFIIIYGFSMVFSSEAKCQSVSENPTISKVTEDNTIIAYPNPVKTSVVIKTKDTQLKIKTVAFYSILGTQVASFSINNNYAELNLEKLRPGKYLMKYILNDNTSKIKQIIKQ